MSDPKTLLQVLCFLSLFMFLLIPNPKAQEVMGEVWSKEKAESWYAQHDWMSGANFNPSTSVNQIEMWQEFSFDPKTIDKELGWAEEIGFNTMRVYRHHLVCAYAALRD
ncbi:MAG: hypothetical protein U5K69_23490 [Balneolaceae bacterium]|nr:hypothetical protein [Balneolaceae bacterium]